MAAAFGQRLEPMEVDAGDDQQTCRVCFDKPRQCAIRPCGHVTMCELCFHRMVLEGHDQCPMCRRHMEGYLRVYM